MSQPRRNRKGPKRKPARERVDDDLADLITLLDEHRGETSVKGWLSVPWRDGWNAAHLALNIAGAVSQEEYERTRATSHELMDIMTSGNRTQSTYEALEDILRTIRWSSATPALRVAARIMQVVIAKSDGGGHVENVILEPIVTSESEPWMLAHRAIDALGLNVLGTNTPEAVRRKKAFDTAWKRGLYRVAYALPYTE